jgi:ATP-dependent exoDNAse (exonuclease V) beta subunit
VVETLLPDRAARHTIASTVDATLFVEAGAGSGKTSELVERVLALVAAGEDLGAIAAITFTEKAAAELRDRIRVALQQASGDEARPLMERDRCRHALDAVDGAAIGTLHAFAQRLLREHPVEAGLPPAVEVMDEIESQVAFEERWSAFRERLLADPGLERVLLLADALGVELKYLEEIAEAFDDDWDLVAERIERDVPDPPPLAIDALVEAARACAELRHDCRFRDDKLAVRLGQLEDWCEEVRLLGDDEVAVLDTFVRLDGRWNVGVRGNWRTDVDDVRESGRALIAIAHDVRARMNDLCLRRLGAELARFTLDAAEERRRHGRLQFHDLLVLARELVRGPHAAAVRDVLHHRYRRILLDEFQDTDPIQIELALRITSPPGTDGADWRSLEAEPGRLFVVGDPKQSIYRFRRADIALFLEARAAIGDGEPLQLHTNFRTVGPVVDWVNVVFGRLIVAEEGAQPAYQPLAAVRRLAADAGPAVSVVGREPHDDEPSADELREREAADVAAAVGTALTEGWLVEERRGSWRRARAGDVAVLLPARTSLAALEQALDAVGIAYRAESSSLVYATPEIRSLLLAVHAIDDPTNELAVVTTLRSALFGCSDGDLYDWVTRGGRWNPSAERPPSPDDGDDPVGDAMASLGRLIAERPWWSPSELLGRLVAERRVMELGVETGHPADLWRRVRFVIDQARAWSEAGGSGLRAYLRWADRQRAEGTRAAEVVLPETDLDAVRIMTIHAAKGLEFPITVVSGLSTRPKRPSGGGRVIWTADGRHELKAGKGVTTARFDEAATLDEQLDHHERLRLLYVACTRARDHLVVSLHRTTFHDGAEPLASTSATLLARASEGAVHRRLGRAAAQLALALAPPAPREAWEWADVDRWRAERDRALAASGRRRTVAATTLAHDAVPRDEPVDPGLAKEARDLELPPWQKGRYGTAVGRAVHAVLQTVDFATGAGLDDAAAAQAAAEGVLGREGVVAALARSALSAPAVVEAAAAPHWREVYVAAPVGDTLLEGYIDLLYQGPDGLVVVDYKTDHVPDEPSLEARLAHYRRQGAAYALAVERVTGQPVSRCVFVFCSPAGARQREVDDVRDAIASIAADLEPGASPNPPRDR